MDIEAQKQLQKEIDEACIRIMNGPKAPPLGDYNDWFKSKNTAGIINWNITA